MMLDYILDSTTLASGISVLVNSDVRLHTGLHYSHTLASGISILVNSDVRLHTGLHYFSQWYIRTGE